MCQLYHELPDLVLDPDLLAQIAKLDFKKLKSATKYSSIDYIRSLEKYHGLSWSEIVAKWGWSCYGWFFSHTGTLLCFELPKDLEKQIWVSMGHKFTRPVLDDCVIRLQLIYGGHMIPAHVDLTRTCSLIYPISNHDHAYTIFYSRKTPIRSCEQIFNLNDLTEDARVIINRSPVLLDTKHIHAVVFRHPIPKKYPRMSITVKWTTLTVDRILDSMAQRSIS